MFENTSAVIRLVMAETKCSMCGGRYVIVVGLNNEKDTEWVYEVVTHCVNGDYYYSFHTKSPPDMAIFHAIQRMNNYVMNIRSPETAINMEKLEWLLGIRTIEDPSGTKTVPMNNVWKE